MLSSSFHNPEIPKVAGQTEDWLKSRAHSAFNLWLQEG
jgi:hypothetical protein